MAGGIAADLALRLESLKGHRANFDSLWDEVQRIVWPDGGEFRRETTPGEKRTRDVYEMTAALSLEKFAAAMESFMTPRHSQWHSLKASDDNLNDDPSVKEWFEESSDWLFRARNSPRARFYGQMHEAWKSLGAYGNACVFVDEMPTGGTRYRYNHVGHTWMETNFEGVVDTVYYEYELTAKAAHQRWGSEAPSLVASKLQSSPFDKITFLHVVRPNNEFDDAALGTEGMAFESFDVCLQSREQIGKKGGFHEFPYMWSRYTLNPSEMYGRGPAMLVLPDIQTLQDMEKVFLRSGHKVADPPLLVADDGVLGRGSKRVRINPGGINMGAMDINGRPMIAPLQTGARLDLTKEMMDMKRETIRDAFLANLFDLFALDRVQMTATEVLKRAKEKGQILTPVIGRQQSELLGPMIERELGIAQRQGRLKRLPDALVEAEGEYEIVYESDATRMQKADQGASFQRLLEVIAPLVEADPTLLDKFNGEEVVDHFGESFGVPTKVIRTASEMRPLREAQAQAAEEAQAMEAVPAAAGAVRDLSAAGVAA